MRRLFSLLGSLLLLVPVWAAAQGGALGQGSAFGGVGGGFGAGMGTVGPDPNGRFSENHPFLKPLDQDGIGTGWVERTAILTPGDVVEFKFHLRQGETLTAWATSDAFDSALQVTDSANKELLLVDDRIEGDQSPFLSFLAPSEGDYKLNVRSYRATSGGQFRLQFRTFQSALIEPGREQELAIPRLRGNTGDRTLLRVPLQKGQIFDLASLWRAPNRGMPFGQVVRVFSPRGVPREDFDLVRLPGSIVTIEAKIGGDFYLEIYPYGDGNASVSSQLVPVVASAADATKSLVIEKNQVAIFEWDIRANGLIRSTLTHSEFPDQALPTVFEIVDGTGGTEGTRDPGMGSQDGFVWLLPRISRPQDMVRIYTRDGKARFSVRNPNDRAQTVTLTNTDKLPEWDFDQTLSGSLELGESRIFLFRSKAAELKRVDASATSFQPQFDILEINGAMANSLTAPTSKQTGDTLYFPQAKTYIGRLSCFGHGGSGDFRLTQSSQAATPYKLGQVRSARLEANKITLFEVTLEGGKYYEVVRQPQVQFDLIQPDGGFLGGATQTYGDVVQTIIRPPTTGTYRIWLRGDRVEPRFKITEFTPPKIGGG